MAARDIADRLRESVWHGSIPLEIRLSKSDCRTYDDSPAYLIQFPRLSYLALLTPRLHAFFAPSLILPSTPPDLWLSHESVPLKWHYPLGLLYDIYSGAEPYAPSSPANAPLPWRLTLHASRFPGAQLVRLDAAQRTMHDLFIHAVKEADYLRSGTGKTVMFLSRADSTQLWDAVVGHDFERFHQVNSKLLNPQGVRLRHLPVRLYLPHGDGGEDASVRVVQSLVRAEGAQGQAQTVGAALNQILPTLFPSRRSALLAQPVLHGAVVPLGVSVEELLRSSAYLDGWLHIAIVMMG